MQIELDVENIDPCLLREKQLKERINREIRGGAVSYAYADSPPKFHSIRKSLKAWFKVEKWWFLAMLTATIIYSTVWMLLPYGGNGGVWFWVWLWSVWLGQFWAFCIGTTVGSRLLIILFWSFVGGVAVGSSAAAYESGRYAY